MVEACRFVARAFWGPEMVAESKGAVRVDDPGRTGRSPVLYFPRGDVRLDRFRREEDMASGPDPSEGTPEWWSAPGDAAGRRLVRTFPDPPEERAWLSAMAAFDHDRVVVELVDPGAGGPGDATVKRFPDWGDVEDLVGLLDVGPAGRHTYQSTARADRRRRVVEGSQMLAQAIVAAGREIPGRRPVSGWMAFLRAADPAVPLHFELEELSAGRTFAALGARVTQQGGLRAAGSLLLDVTAPDVVRHAVEAPDVPGPYDSVPLDMGVTGRDIRVVESAYDGDPGAPVGPPVIDAWVRFSGVPDDPVLHAGLLAQFTGHMSIAAALRPHPGYGEHQAHRTLSTAVNAISLSLHRDVRVDRWILYRHRSTFAGAGMTHSECRVHDEEGDLLASFGVDAMVRAFPGHRRPFDERTAL